MPRIGIIYFSDKDGKAPLLGCFDSWPQKVLDKCYVRLARLEQLGHELRRPEADILRDGIYELRIRHLNVNYRILYFFYQQKAVLFNGLTKEDEVPNREIEKAVAAKQLFSANPKQHTYEADENEI